MARDHLHAGQQAGNAGNHHPVRGHQMASAELTRVLVILVFFNYLSHSLPKPVVPEMMSDYFGDNVFLATAVSMGLQNLGALFLLPFVGGLSDAVGRKPCLIAGLLFSQCPEWVLAFTSNMYVYLALEATLASTHLVSPVIKSPSSLGHTGSILALLR